MIISRVILILSIAIGVGYVVTAILMIWATQRNKGGG
jgi:hypothetical protein